VKGKLQQSFKADIEFQRLSFSFPSSYHKCLHELTTIKDTPSRKQGERKKNSFFSTTNVMYTINIINFEVMLSLKCYS
jgi:hypothetical protein